MSLNKDLIIMLDIGNVLVSVDMDSMHQAAVTYGFTNFIEEGYSFMKGIENVCNFGIMDMSSAIDMFWGYKKDIWGPNLYKNNKNRLIDHWCSKECVKLNEKIVDYCNSIINKTDYILKMRNVFNFNNVFVMLASNMGTDHYDYIIELHPFFKNEKLSSVFSFKVGSVKPQEKFFCNANKKVKKAQVLYIDDRQENLDVAKKVIENIETFMFDSTAMNEEYFIETVNNYIKQKFGGETK